MEAKKAKLGKMETYKSREWGEIFVDKFSERENQMRFKFINFSTYISTPPFVPYLERFGNSIPVDLA